MDMKIVFLGNHTVGVKTLQAISETEEVAGVMAHPPDEEDGVKYQSVYKFACRRGWPVIRARAKDPTAARFIEMAKPDLLWITDYRFLIPLSLIGLAPQGVINLHPSLLPKYRGRASVNWAILNGEEELGLSAHFVDEGMDTGPIIEQYRFELREDQDVGDALEILYPLYQNITRQVLGRFHSNSISTYPQDHRLASVFPARKPEEGVIDWRKPARGIRDLIRAVTHPYPGAFTYWEKRKILIWKACLDSVSRKGLPGQVVSAGPESQLCGACGEGTLRILDYNPATLAGKATKLRVGDCLGC
jgi:methionyl-tRNA formyltransferase